MEAIEVVGRVGDQVIVGIRDEASLYHRVLSRLKGRAAVGADRDGARRSGSTKCYEERGERRAQQPKPRARLSTTRDLDATVSLVDHDVSSSCVPAG